MTVKVYQVGGAVRDQLLGVVAKDIDFAVEAGSYEEMRAWVADRGKIYLEKPEFLTIKAHLAGREPADFVMCRKDGFYSDGRRPDEVVPGTIYDDLARRDFTVNAMAFDESTGTYLDPHGGRKDLGDKVLRCVGDTYTRFCEDPLRLLRAVRFKITKGFRISDDIITCLDGEDDGCELLDKLKRTVSVERVREELLKCFKHNTLETIRFLSKYHEFQAACFDGPLWLMPTVKATS